MTGDQWSMTAFITVVIYVWGTLNRGWTSPVDIGGYIACRSGVHRWCGHENPSSDDVDDDEPGNEPDMSAPTPDPTLRTMSAPVIGPVPIEDLTHHVRYPHDEASTDRQQGEPGPAWTRRVLDAGLLDLSEVDAVGAAKFGVHPDTVRRWRRILRNSADTGSGSGKDQRGPDPAGHGGPHRVRRGAPRAGRAPQ